MHRSRRGRPITWWRHQMETFSALLAICAGNLPFTGEFLTQRPVTRSFDVFFDLRLNKRLSKQSWGWWFETPSRPSWRHRNVKQPTGDILSFKNFWDHRDTTVKADGVIWGFQLVWRGHLVSGPPARMTSDRKCQHPEHPYSGFWTISGLTVEWDLKIMNVEIHSQ